MGRHERMDEQDLANLDWIGREAESFLQQFPHPEQATPALSVTWEALERQLASLAGCPRKKALVGPLLSATRKQAWCKPPEMVLREVLVIAGVLQDESFSPGPDETGGASPMT
jgi:hypothetical protein